MLNKKQIEDMIERAARWNSEHATQFKNMTFEQGVEEALSWVIGEQDEEPIPVPDDAWSKLARDIKEL